MRQSVGGTERRTTHIKDIAYVLYSPLGPRPLEGLEVETSLANRAAEVHRGILPKSIHPVHNTGSAVGKLPCVRCCYDRDTRSQVLYIAPTATVSFMPSRDGRSTRRREGAPGSATSVFPASYHVLAVQLCCHAPSSPLASPLALRVELTVRDACGGRRLLFSSVAKDILFSTHHAKIPIRCVNPGQWTNLYFDLSSLQRSAFGNGGTLCSPRALRQVRIGCNSGVFVRRVLAMRELPSEDTGSCTPQSLRLPDTAGRTLSLFIKSGREPELVAPPLGSPEDVEKAAPVDSLCGRRAASRTRNDTVTMSEGPVTTHLPSTTTNAERRVPTVAKEEKEARADEPSEATVVDKAAYSPQCHTSSEPRIHGYGKRRSAEVALARDLTPVPRQRCYGYRDQRSPCRTPTTSVKNADQQVHSRVLDGGQRTGAAAGQVIPLSLQSLFIRTDASPSNPEPTVVAVAGVSAVSDDECEDAVVNTQVPHSDAQTFAHPQCSATVVEKWTVDRLSPCDSQSSGHFVKEGQGAIMPCDASQQHWELPATHGALNATDDEASYMAGVALVNLMGERVQKIQDLLSTRVQIAPGSMPLRCQTLPPQKKTPSTTFNIVHSEANSKTGTSAPASCSHAATQTSPLVTGLRSVAIDSSRLVERIIFPKDVAPRQTTDQCVQTDYAPVGLPPMFPLPSRQTSRSFAESSPVAQGARSDDDREEPSPPLAACSPVGCIAVDRLCFESTDENTLEMWARAVESPTPSAEDPSSYVVVHPSKGEDRVHPMRRQAFPSLMGTGATSWTFKSTALASETESFSALPTSNEGPLRASPYCQMEEGGDTPTKVPQAGASDDEGPGYSLRLTESGVARTRDEKMEWHQKLRVCNRRIPGRLDSLSPAEGDYATWPRICSTGEPESQSVGQEIVEPPLPEFSGGAAGTSQSKEDQCNSNGVSAMQTVTDFRCITPSQLPSATQRRVRYNDVTTDEDGDDRQALNPSCGQPVPHDAGKSLSMNSAFAARGRDRWKERYVYDPVLGMYLDLKSNTFIDQVFIEKR